MEKEIVFNEKENKKKEGKKLSQKKKMTKEGDSILFNIHPPFLKKEKKKCVRAIKKEKEDKSKKCFKAIKKEKENKNKKHFRARKKSFFRK